MRALLDAWYLARRHLAAAPVRTGVLVLGVALALFLPLFTTVAVRLAERFLWARADASGVLVGHEGSEIDLTLATLYFKGSVRRGVPARVVDRLLDGGYGVAIPLHIGHTAQGAPVVGTSLDYLDARGLRVAEGRAFAVLGEVVAGARLAEERRLRVGDRLRSDTTDLYNLAGAYPVALEVVGVLARSGGPDDDALLGDVTTTWWLDGYFHGHGNVVASPGAPPTPAAGGDPGDGRGAPAAVEASAATFLFAELGEEERAAVHLHGEQGDLPLTAVMVLPHSPRRRDQLLGELATDPELRAVRPREVVASVLDVVAHLSRGLLVVFVLIGLSTLAFAVVVLVLSVRLRDGELRLYRRLGASRRRVAAILGLEVAVLLLAAAVVAGAATLAGAHLVAGLFGAG